MTEKIIDIQSAPSYLASLINTLSTEKIKISNDNRVITIVPAVERKYNCPLLGAAVGSKLTVERFHEITREENDAW